MIGIEVVIYLFTSHYCMAAFTLRPTNRSHKSTIFLLLCKNGTKLISVVPCLDMLLIYSLLTLWLIGKTII